MNDAMIRIPTGWFRRGSDDRFSWESPRRRVYTDSFEIAATTVTRATYAEFLRESGHTLPKGWNDRA